MEPLQEAFLEASPAAWSVGPHLLGQAQHGSAQLILIKEDGFFVCLVFEAGSRYVV